MKKSFPLIACLSLFSLPLIVVADDDKDSDKESTVDSEVLESDPKKILQSAIDAVSRDDGWAALASIGHYINKNHPSFDSRNYGYEKLGQLVKNTAGLEVDEKSAGDGSHVVHIFVRSSS